MSYKINASIEFNSNVSKLVANIQSELKRVGNVNIGVNKGGIDQLKRSITDISSSLKNINSVSTGNKSVAKLQQDVTSLSKSVGLASNSFKGFRTSVNDSQSELEKFGRTTAATIRRFSAFIGIVTIFNDF